jgi:pimeloyl-ACP methyl ester carboxylesterase
VYLSDQPCRGRSPWHPSVGATGTEATSDAEQFFTATWENEYWPQSRLHTQWPGTGKVGDPTFDAFYASQVQYLLDFAISESLSTKAYSALLDKIGAAHIVTYSQAGTFGWRIGDARPSLVKSIVALEPTSPPFDGPPLFPGKPRSWGLTYQEIVYEPSAGVDASLLDTVSVLAKDAQHSECILQREPARKLKNLAKIPVLFVLGEASFLQPYGYCTVEYLRQAGVQVEFADLVEEGIRGNGHMLFLE